MWIFWPDFWVEFWKVNSGKWVWGSRANFLGASFAGKKDQKIRAKNSGPKIGRPKFVSQNSAPNSGSGGAKSPVECSVWNRALRNRSPPPSNAINSNSRENLYLCNEIFLPMFPQICFWNGYYFFWQHNSVAAIWNQLSSEKCLSVIILDTAVGCTQRGSSSAKGRVSAF